MGSRRRNLVILGLVLALAAASVYAITSKETVLGLDLRGGTELVYQASPTAKNPEIDPEDMDRAIDILRERTDELGVSEPEIARIGPDQIEVGLPDVSNADRAIEQVGSTAQLFLYDFERNVIPPDPTLDNATERRFNRLYDAVEFAGEARPRVLPGPVHHHRAHLLPVRREHARAARRPGRVGGGPLSGLARRKATGGNRGSRGAPGDGRGPGRATVGRPRRPRSTRARAPRPSTSC